VQLWAKSDALIVVLPPPDELLELDDVVVPPEVVVPLEPLPLLSVEELPVLLPVPVPTVGSPGPPTQPMIPRATAIPNVQSLRMSILHLQR
jgi:hypothetical protein